MATQNSTITVKGKLGNIVGYKGRNGKRMARIRQTEVYNPKTEAQTIQRMILATAAKAYSRMKGIVDHSFQGVQYGGVSQSYFLKRAMEDIRNWIAQTISITGEYPATLRNPLVYRGLSFPLDAHQAGVGLLISEGTIPSVAATLNTPVAGADAVVDYFGSLINADGDRPLVRDVMNSFGAQKGDQITSVGLLADGSFSASRYVIKSDASDDDLDGEWETDAAAFDELKTIYGNVHIDFKAGASANQRKAYVSASAGELIAAAIIISRKVGDVWQRSTQRLVWLSDAGDYTYTSNVIAEWMAGTTPINTGNPRYLNQAEQAVL